MASATCTPSRTRSYTDVVRPTRDPSLKPPARFERVPKQPGSKKLVHGEWVDVKPDDEDAVKETGPAQSHIGGVRGARDGAI